MCTSKSYFLVLWQDLPVWTRWLISGIDFTVSYESVQIIPLVPEVMLSMDIHRTLAILGMSLRHLSQFWHDSQWVFHSFTPDFHGHDDQSECFFSTTIYFWTYFKPFFQSCHRISMVLITVTLQQYMYVRVMVFSDDTVQIADHTDLLGGLWAKSFCTSAI